MHKVLGEAEMSKTWPLTWNSRDRQWKRKKRMRIKKDKERGDRDKEKKENEEEEKEKKHCTEHNAKYFTYFIPFHKYWNWSSKSLTIKVFGRLGFIPSHCSQSWQWGPFSLPHCLGKHKQVKRKLSDVVRTLWAVLSALLVWDQGLVSCSSRISLSVHPCARHSPALARKEKKTSHGQLQGQRLFSSERHRKRGSLQRHGLQRPNTGRGDGRRGPNWSLKHSGSSPQFSLSLAAFKLHSLFQWDLGIGLTL